MSNILFAILCLTIFLMPLPYGSVEEWSIFIFEAVTFVLFGLCLIVEYLNRNKNTGTGTDYKKNRTPSPYSPPPNVSSSNSHERLPVVRRSKVFYVLCALLALFFILTILQIVPIPSGLVKTLSPRAYEIYQISASTSATPLPRFLTLSLSPALTSYELVKYLAYLLFAALIYRLVNTRVRIEIFVWTLLVSGLFQAIYGLTELWSGSGSIFGWKNLYDQGSAFGTFVNRDHFSGFLEMIFPLGLGYLLAKAGFFRLPDRLSLKEKILWFAEERLQKTLLIGLVPVVLGIGLIFSLSRTGITIFVGSIFLMSFVSPLALSSRRASGADSHFPPPSHRHMPKAVRAVFVVVLFASLGLGLAPVLKRFTKESMVFNLGRPVFYKNTLDLINSYFLFGSGQGTFVYTYPQAAKVYEPTILSHAHNDYLETLAESGAPSGGALILAALLAFSVLFARWLRRHDAFVRGVGLGALTGILALLVHSLMDFNLRIPANALLFVSLCALAFRVLTLNRPKFLAR